MDQKILIWRSGDVTMACHEPKMDQIKRQEKQHESSHEGLEEEAKTSGARASAVAFRKFVF